MNEPPEQLVHWLAEERTRAFANLPYGKLLADAWRSAVKEGQDIRASQGDFLNRLQPDARDFASHFYDSNFSKNTEIPFYHGYLIQSQLLASESARKLNDGDDISVAVTTRPTNHRFAAVYRPIVAPGWSVIVVDFGFLSAVIGISVILSRFIEFADSQPGLSFRFPSQSAEQFFSNDERSRSDVVKFLLPCLHLSSEDAPFPLPLDNEDHRRNIAAVLFIRSILYIVIAHEIAHVVRNHRRLSSTPIVDLHRMEIEADCLALMFAADNPWRRFAYFAGGETAVVMQHTAIQMQAMIISALKMIVLAEGLAKDAGHQIEPDDSHPDPTVRLSTAESIIDSFNLPSPTRNHIRKTRQKLNDFMDSMWFAIRDDIKRELESRGASGAIMPEVREVRNAELHFS